MLFSPAQFSNLLPQELQMHFRFLAEQLPNKSSIEIGCANVVIPCQKQVFKTKDPRILMRFRVSYINRSNLENLHKVYSNKSYDLKIRYSEKRKKMSQFYLNLKISDNFPIEAISVLRTLSAELGIAWPPVFSVGYAKNQFGPDLPGDFSINDPCWKAGNALGKSFGKLFGKILK